ncbi:MAG: Crp/Fnr family transcriptional regulator [Flavobacteriales bacterium]|nr:Crp/Fnr family transcriptional regulator [Flavobacteriales bacterium]
MMSALVRRTIARYVELSDPEWALVLAPWESVYFRKGEFVSSAGSIEDRFYVVQEGVQRLFFEHDGNEHCLGFSYDGSWCGDFDSFVRQRPGRFQVQAITESRLAGIRYADMHRLYAEVPSMERFGRLILEELLCGRATREIEIISLNAEERYRRLIERSPHLLQLVPQKDIASYLHMTPETFSRLRARIR